SRPPDRPTASKFHPRSCVLPPELWPGRRLQPQDAGGSPQGVSLPMAFHTGTTSTFDAPDTPAPGLTACPWCDLLQREAVCTTSCVVRCWRCDGIIYRAIPGALDTALALTLAAAALFAIANVFPVMSLDLQGQHVSARLVDIVWSLQREGMAAIGAVVLVTLILTPALQIAARLYLLLPLRLGRTPRALAAASRVLDTMRRWSM